MAKVGYGPKDFDPSDYQAAVRRLCSFLETLERVADEQEHWPPREIDGTFREHLIFVIREVVEAAYMVAEVGPPDFSVLPFVTKIVLQLDEMRKACDAILGNRAPDEDGIVPEWTIGQSEALISQAWVAILADYPEFRGPLKLLELRSKHRPEAAPESGRPAADVQTTDEALSPSEAEVGREWNQVIQAMEADALADEREFDAKDVTDVVAYEYLVELLKSEDKEPSQTFETWRKYVSKFRRAAGNPKRRRRLR
jgi:hypothetical protein